MCVCEILDGECDMTVVGYLPARVSCGIVAQSSSQGIDLKMCLGRSFQG